MKTKICLYFSTLPSPNPTQRPNGYNLIKIIEMKKPNKGWSVKWSEVESSRYSRGIYYLIYGLSCLISAES